MVFAASRFGRGASGADRSPSTDSRGRTDDGPAAFGSVVLRRHRTGPALDRRECEAVAGESAHTSLTRHCSTDEALLDKFAERLAAGQRVVLSPTGTYSE
jgi:hypothetical protein